MRLLLLVVVADVGQSVVCPVVIISQKPKQDRPRVWNTIQKQTPLILLQHSDSPLDPLGWGNRPRREKHGCGPAFYNSGDNLVVYYALCCFLHSVYPVRLVT